MEIFRLFGSIFIDDTEASKSLQKTDQQAQGVGRTLQDTIKTAAKWGVAIGAAATAAGGALFALVNKVTDTGAAIDAKRKQLGITSEALQEYGYAADQVGISQSSMEQALGRLNQRIGMAAQGNKKYEETLEKLNVTSKNADEAFLQAIETLHQMDDANLQAAMAAELFGTKLGRELMPAIQAGGEEMLALRNRAHDLGKVMDQDTTIASNNFQSALSDVKGVLTGISQDITKRVLPTFEKWMVWTADNIPKAWAVFQFLGEVIAIVFKYVRLIIGDAVTWMRDKALNPFVNWLTDVWSDRGPPILAAVELLWEGIKNIFSNVFGVIQGLWDAFILVFQGDWEGAWEKLKETAASYWNAIPNMFRGIFEPLISIADNIMQAVIAVIRNVFGDKVADHFETIWDTILIVFDLFRDTFMGMWRAFSALFQGDWAGAWEEVKGVFSNIWNALPTIIENAFTSVFGIVDALARNIIEIIRDVFGDNVASVFEAIWESMTIIFQTGLDVVLGLFEVFSAAFRGDWEGVWQGVVNIFSTIWDGLVGIFTGPLGAVTDFVKDWAVKLAISFINMKNRAVESVKGVADGIKEWFSETKLGKTFGWLKDTVEDATGWFYNMYDKVVGNSYIPDMVEEIGEAIERLKHNLANPVARYTAEALGDFENLEDGAVAAMMSMAERMDEVLSGIVDKVSGAISAITREFWNGTATWSRVLNTFAGTIGGIFGSIFDTIAKEMVKNIVAQNTWLVSTLANIATAVTAYLGQAYAALTAFFWFLGPGAPAAAAGVIAAAVAGIAALGGKVVGSIMGGLGIDPGGNDDVDKTKKGSGGRQVSEITGPTRDLLTDLLSPLANFGQVVAPVQDIRNILDTRLPNFNNLSMDFAGAGAIGGDIVFESGAIVINSSGTSATELSRDMLDAIEREMARRINFGVRGRGGR